MLCSLAVVPILVNAGTALLPTLAAAATTALALLLRPREWIRLCRDKPRAVLLSMGIATLLTVFIFKYRATHPARAATGTDWTQVALEIIHREQEEKAAVSADLHSIWSFQQPSTSFLSTPLIKNGRVFAASCLLDVGGTFGSIFCLDAETGKLIWQTDKLDGRDLKAFFSSPAISADGRSIVIGEGLHFDTKCHLICLNAATGKLRWKIDVPKNHVESSPTIFGDFVVVGAGAIEHADHKPAESPGYVLAVRVSDGQVLWQRDVIDPESSPAIAHDGIVFIGSGVNGNAVVALRDGNIVWKTPTPYPAMSNLALAGDFVLAGTGRGDFVNADSNPAGAVFALDRKTGSIRWKAELGDTVLGDMAVSGGRVFCPVRNGKVVALDLENGREVWSQNVNGNAPVLAGVAVDKNRIFAVSSDGFLAVLDASDGHIVKKRRINAESDPGRQNLCTSTPVVAGDRVFVGSETGGLQCFSLP